MKVYKSNNKKSKFSALAICLLLTALLTVGGTLAYLFTSTDPVVNTFEPVKQEITVTEEFDGQTKENVKIKNTGDIDAYIRAEVVINWIDEDGNILPSTPEKATYKVDWAFDDLDIDGNAVEETSNWVEYGGYYYYTVPVAPEAFTKNLINLITVSYPVGSEFRLDVAVAAQSVQATPEAAVNETWKVTIAKGSVTAYSAP